MSIFQALGSPLSQPPNTQHRPPKPETPRDILNNLTLRTGSLDLVQSTSRHKGTDCTAPSLTLKLCHHIVVCRCLLVAEECQWHLPTQTLLLLPFLTGTEGGFVPAVVEERNEDEPHSLTLTLKVAWTTDSHPRGFLPSPRARSPADGLTCQAPVPTARRVLVEPASADENRSSVSPDVDALTRSMHRDAPGRAACTVDRLMKRWGGFRRRSPTERKNAEEKQRGYYQAAAWRTWFPTGSGINHELVNSPRAPLPTPPPISLPPIVSSVRAGLNSPGSSRRAVIRHPSDSQPQQSSLKAGSGRLIPRDFRLNLPPPARTPGKPSPIHSNGTLEQHGPVLTPTLITPATLHLAWLVRSSAAAADNVTVDSLPRLVDLRQPSENATYTEASIESSLNKR
ncbi:hypothetical protein DPEC_G00263450 [Dallia pectoralis]|uniref:Uncharacterized protein n=1 Tax=Dallia pectoralis TaxID=75939 RepID=A0ACC2FSA0_DALPE|nr:hypothetical protein DPEC_G00263450 [Dallia pectoralis]